MKFSFVASSVLFFDGVASAFTQSWCKRSGPSFRSMKLHVSIGLGPDKEKNEGTQELVAGQDYEVPDHESYRTSRRSKLDEQCDKWFESLMGDEFGCLGSLAEEAKEVLMTKVPLVNEVCCR
jgi:hypothetical protein